MRKRNYGSLRAIYEVKNMIHGKGGSKLSNRDAQHTNAEPISSGESVVRIKEKRAQTEIVEKDEDSKV
jgi:hypothetical protein